MEARITDIREIEELPVTSMGSGVYLVEEDGIEYGVHGGSCGCGATEAYPCTHIEATQAADIGASRPDRGALAYQYLLVDEALRRLVEAREALAAAALGGLSEAVCELVEQVEEEADLTWGDLWGGSLDLV